MLSLLCGLLFALLLFPALAIVERRARRKYSAFEKTIDSPIRYTVNGNFSLGKRVRNGNLYFCDDRIVMASADENPFIEKQIPAQDIEKFEFGNGRMTICLKDGTNVSIATAQAAEIPQLLSALGWAKQTTL